MPDEILRIATRKSPLALWQANFVGELIKRHWPHVKIELVPMVTSGDRFLKDKLQAIGGKGLFVKELEEALLDGRADLAVHSMKDVPALLPEGLSIAAICERDNPFDAFISPYTSLNALPEGSIVGTASLRRQSQLHVIRPDIIIKPLRGNINTRLDKLKNAEFDAIILAAAGLFRMGMENHIQEILSEDIMLPACGQGALGIECRDNDDKIQQILTPLNDTISASCVNVERHVNGLLGGNCHVPLAVYCKINAQNQLFLRAKLLTLDGKMMITDEQTGSFADALALAEKCANNMLAKGALELLDSL